MKRRTFLKNTLALATVPALGTQLLAHKANANTLLRSGLHELYKDNFLIGTMVPLRKFLVPQEAYTNIVNRDFNSIATQNVFKWEHIHPGDEHWNWVYTDRFVDYGKKLKKHIVGHNLVSASNLPTGLLLEKPDQLVGKATLLNKMEKHVSTLVDRYKGRIDAWDVVNEVIDDYEPKLVKNCWQNIIGPEYVERAFQIAHEADPKATLIYNDYNLSNKNKRDFAVELIRDLKNKHVPIHAIGMQGHFSLEGPDLAEVEASIEAFAAEGLRIHFTEMEVDVLPALPENPEQEPGAEELNPYVAGLPAEIDEKLSRRYQQIFALFNRHKEKIDRVTFWGTTDDDSWKNDFPVEGRTNHALLYDRDHQPKAAYQAIVESGNNNE